VASKFRKVLSRLVDDSPPVLLEVLLLPEVLLVLEVLLAAVGFCEVCGSKGAVTSGLIP
jgi:hypothetical protein